MREPILRTLLAEIGVRDDDQWRDHPLVVHRQSDILCGRFLAQNSHPLHRQREEDQRGVVFYAAVIWHIDVHGVISPGTPTSAKRRTL